MASKMGIHGCLAVVALLLHVAPAVNTLSVKWPAIPSNGDDYLTLGAKVREHAEFIGNINNVEEFKQKGFDTYNVMTSSPPPMPSLNQLNAETESTPVINRIIPTDTIGLLYYICTDPVRCKGGQKLRINVSNSDGTVTPSGPSPLDGPSGSSSSLTVSGFFITLASYIVAFLY